MNPDKFEPAYIECGNGVVEMQVSQVNNYVRPSSNKFTYLHFCSTVLTFNVSWLYLSRFIKRDWQDLWAAMFSFAPPVYINPVCFKD